MVLGEGATGQLGGGLGFWLGVFKKIREKSDELCGKLKHKLLYIVDFRGYCKNYPANLRNVPGITRTFQNSK